MNKPAGVPALKQKPPVKPLPAPGAGKLLNPHSPPFTPRLSSFPPAKLAPLAPLSLALLDSSSLLSLDSSLSASSSLLSLDSSLSASSSLLSLASLSLASSDSFDLSALSASFDSSSLAPSSLFSPSVSPSAAYYSTLQHFTYTSTLPALYNLEAGNPVSESAEVESMTAADLSELVLWCAFIECDIHHLYFEPIVEIDSELRVLSIFQRKKIVEHLLAGISKYQLIEDGTRCWRVLQCLKDLCF